MNEKKFSVKKFEYLSSLNLSNFTIMNFDFIAIGKDNRPIIFEWLKRGPEQKDHITPLTSSPERYINMNKGKFFAYQEAINNLNASVFYVNYAPENTIINGINISNQIKVMQHIDLSFKDNTPLTNKIFQKPLKIKTKVIATFYSFEDFSNWLKNFLEQKSFKINSLIKEDKEFTKNEAIAYIKSKEEEYEIQQNKARENKKFNKYLVMPDLSGDIFEDRLNFDISKYRYQIDFSIKYDKNYIFTNLIELDMDPFLYNDNYLLNLIYKNYNFSKFIDFNNKFMYIFFSLNTDNIRIITFENNSYKSYFYLKNQINDYVRFIIYSSSK